MAANVRSSQRAACPRRSAIRAESASLVTTFLRGCAGVLNRPILTAALLVLLVFGFLTGYVIVTTGFGPLEAISLLVLGLFAFGIVGALRQPPE
jgi:hypothetical protein